MDPKVTTGEALVQLADELRVDLLFVGSYGRKGAKSGVGSTATLALRDSACSACLVRCEPNARPRDSPSTWCVAVDGGKSGMMAFAAVLKEHAVPGRDKIHVLCADFEQSSAKALEPYRQVLEQDGRFQHECCFAAMPNPELDNPGSVPEELLTRAERAGADFLVLGISGSTKLGSVCQDILALRSKTSVLMHKNDQEAAMKRSASIHHSKQQAKIITSLG